MKHCTRNGIAAALIVIVGALIFAVRADRGPEVELGTAVQSFDAGSSAAARSPENVTYEDMNLELVATHVVIDGEIDPREEVPIEHRALWDEISRVLPASALVEIRQLNVVTDGPRGTLAMVHRSGVADDQWILSVDLAEPTDVLDVTLAHEYAHMLTLRREDLTTAAGSCDGVKLEIGCARKGSLLAQWADAFWTGLPEPADSDSDVFVSEYAASSVHEDFAESFLAYVTGEHRDTPTIAAKVAFFDAHVDLAAAAAELRPRVTTS